MKRQNIEFRWGWFDALRRRDTKSMAALLDPGIVWQDVRRSQLRADCRARGERVRGGAAAFV